ncbi:hypothetical protein RRF57_009019 [Xylaria bambusicola]|uniref:Uncharacterized protein n=1 Tax=Xylaria bambusicola TaxID=326684 RepID=A0AAN7Z182_9PEZI
MLKYISIPLEHNPLLAGSENIGYSTIKVKPKLHIIIPPYSHPVEGLAALDDNLITTMDDTNYEGDVSVIYTPCARTGYCDYCLEQGLDHNLQADRQRRQSTRAMETQRDGGTFDAYLSFYACLLGIVMFLLLFFLYYSGCVDMYPNSVSTPSHRHASALPKSLGLDIYFQSMNMIIENKNKTSSVPFSALP